MRNEDYSQGQKKHLRINRSQKRGEHSANKSNHLLFLIPYFSFLILCWVFFQFWYPYHFFFQEQNQLFLWTRDYIVTYFDHRGGLAELVGDFLTQFYYYLYVGAAILTLCLAAIGLMLDRALRNFGIHRAIALTASLLLMAYVANCHLDATYRLPATITMMAWVALLWGVSAVKGRKLRLACLAVGLLPVGLLFGLPEAHKPGKPNLALEDTFSVDCEYYFGNYDKVIQIVESKNKWTKEMIFFYNLVQAQRDQLPDNLLRFTPNNLGTFTHIGPKAGTMAIRNQNELYWVLGDMTFTERAAMMANVSSHNNRNVRMIRRLAECNIVSGDSLAAEKHLRLLDKTLAHRQRAKWLREHGKEAFREKIRLANHHDTITTTDNTHFLMMQLLDSHPDCPAEIRNPAENTVALDYILCSNLLLKDVKDFKLDYDRYCSDTPRLKTLYQEALCVWLAITQASKEEWRKYILLPDVRKRFIEYNDHRGDPRYKDTYWYYYDKIKTPQI